MADPLTQAAESLAPARPTTRFFAPEGYSGVNARYADATQDLRGAEEVLKASSRIAGSRWDRVSRRRQQEMWGRQDEDYAAEKDFEARRGEFLKMVGGLDPNAEDYEAAKNEIIANMPEEAMRDDGVKAIFAANDRVWADRMRARDDERREQIYYRRWQKQNLERAKLDAAEAGFTPEEIAEMAEDPYVLGRAVGERQRRLAREKAEFGSELIEGRSRARGTGGGPVSRKAREDALEVFTANPNYFGQPTEEEAEAGVTPFDAAIRTALTMEEDAYVESADEPSKVGREARRALWRHAQSLREDLGTEEQITTPDETAGLPTKTLPDGTTYYWVDGRWQLKD